jgi:integrase
MVRPKNSQKAGSLPDWRLDRAHILSFSHTLLPSSQAVRTSCRYAPRSRCLPRTLRLPGESGRVRPAYRGMGLQGPTAPRAGFRVGRRSHGQRSEPIKPVPDAFVDAIRPHVSRQVWAMIQLQRLTAMQPGEACSMRTIDVDTSGRVWIYTRSEPETEHHGKERRLYLGPLAQAILEPWLRTELTAFLFSPRDAMAESKARLRRRRKAPSDPLSANTAPTGRAISRGSGGVGRLGPRSSLRLKAVPARTSRVRPCPR